MPTNPIGRGTRNLSVNVPTLWHSLLGRKAFTMDISMGELARRLMARGRRIFRANAIATSASNDDAEALNVLRTAIADGLQPDDLPAIHKAIELVERSAKKDAYLARSLDFAEVFE